MTSKLTEITPLISIGSFAIEWSENNILDINEYINFFVDQKTKHGITHIAMNVKSRWLQKNQMAMGLYKNNPQPTPASGGEMKFDDDVKSIIGEARIQVNKTGHPEMGPEHLFLACLNFDKTTPVKILKSLNVKIDDLRISIISSMGVSTTTEQNVSRLNKEAEKALKLTYLEATILKSKVVHPEHLVLAILKLDECAVTKVINQYGINYDILREEIENYNHYKSL